MPKATIPNPHRFVTITGASHLPGMIGRIAPAMLRAHGAYRYTEVQPDGKSVRVDLKKMGEAWGDTPMGERRPMPERESCGKW